MVVTTLGKVPCHIVGLLASVLTIGFLQAHNGRNVEARLLCSPQSS